MRRIAGLHFCFTLLIFGIAHARAEESKPAFSFPKPRGGPYVVAPGEYLKKKGYNAYGKCKNHYRILERKDSRK